MNIIVSPNPILREKTKPVEEITGQIKNLIAKMRQKLKKANGVGLAANQVGAGFQIFIIEPQLAKNNNVPDVYINPEVIERSLDQVEMEEGCLSLPDLWFSVKRAKKMRLKAIDENGRKIKIKAKGFLARVFQHEYDHLRGILITDHLKDHL